VAHIDHAIKICGEDHVGIGTDYGIIRLGDMTALRAHYADMVNQRRAHGISAPGEDPRFLPYADDLTGPDQFRTLAARLAERGYTQTRIEKLMGQNFLRFAQEIWGT
jgi:membrane dipeptidase